MNVVVLGNGFTGILTAIAIKKNCPDVTVTIVKSPTIKKNEGFGEAGPFNLLPWILNTLQIPKEQHSSWVNRFLVETDSTVKYAAHYTEFSGKHVPGVMIDIVNSGPDYRVILNNLIYTGTQNQSLIFPTADQYTLFDIWYELYKNGRKDLSESSQDLNPYHWHHIDRKISVDYPTSMHMNSFKVGDWLENEYKSELNYVVGNVQQASRTPDGFITHLILDDGRQVNGDIFLDCSGFNRVLGKLCDLKWVPVTTIAGHNSALITANGYESIDTFKKQVTPHTDISGKDWGWMFRIPTLTRESYGYVFNSDQTDQNKISQEFDEYSNPLTRVLDPFVIKWNPGYYETSMQHNFALVGLSNSFIDPFDAASIFGQVQQINMLIRYIRTSDEQIKNVFNTHITETVKALVDRIEFTFAAAPRNSSEYWQRFHDMGLRNSILEKFAVELSNNIHAPASMPQGKFQLWPPHIYFMFGLYYGADFSSRLKDTDPRLLDLAFEHFKHVSSYNKKLADYHPTTIEWLKSNNVDVNSLLLNRG